MAIRFNPLTGNFDFTGSGGGGGGASYIDGEVAVYTDLPLDGTAALNSAWLVRGSSGIWPFNKPAGIYYRSATAGVSRDADYSYGGTLGDVFSDSVFLLYDEASTTRTGQFNLGSITAGQNRVLTWPNTSGTIALTSQLADTQIFTANGTWTKPAGAKMVHFIVIGGGGGGGSGRRDNASTNRCGGGGGGGGGISVGWLNESAFGATETITVGAGGAGGAGRVVIGNGLGGTAGGESSIGSVITTFASTGGNGGAGTSATAGGGAINTARIYGPDGATGGGSAGRADAQPAVPTAQLLGPSGGSGGGGISAANAVFTGNVGGTLGNARTSGVILGGTFTASTAGGNGNSGGFNFTGSGGGGGSPDSSTGEGKNGGNGALYGGGGGGGSGSTDPNNSGAGGTGANGIVIITTYF
jgi:hypothetical protein